MVKPDLSIQDLLALGARPLIQLFDQGSAPLNSNLAVLAQAASLRARRHLDVEWLRVANRAYAALAARESGRQARLYERSDMILRGYLLAKLGERPGEPLLNLGEVVRWFRAVTPLSPQEALKLANQPGDGGTQIKLKLRDIKNDLMALKPLEGSALLDGYPEIIEWLRVREALP